MTDFVLALAATVLGLGVGGLLYLHLGLNEGLTMARQYQFDWWLARVWPSFQTEKRLETSRARLQAYEAGVTAANALDVREIATGLAVALDAGAPDFSVKIEPPEALRELHNGEAVVCFLLAFSQSLGRKLGTQVNAAWLPGQSRVRLVVQADR